MFKIPIYLLSAIAAILSMTSCSDRQQDMKAEGNAVYYWRTSLSFDSKEKAFMKQHDIRNIYVRYFDVVIQNGVPMPNATISFENTIPEGVNVIPVVYIMNECLKYDVSTLDKKIIDRIIQMNETNNVHRVKRIQIDCDWTTRSQHTYFALLRRIRKDAAAHSMQLSVTIRLHQLSSPTPPADCGTLMMYNTGHVRNIKCKNPILQLSDVAPYLKYLSKYCLPMNVAYPIFGWQLLYRSGHFVGFMHGGDLETYPGDSIVKIRCSAYDILNVKKAIDKERKGLNNNVLLYTLDKSNIIKYKDEDVKKIFSD